MLSGTLDRRITILQLVKLSDAMGGFEESYTTFATVWGNLKPLRATERYATGMTQNTITTRLLIRYRTDITTDMRAVVDGRTYHIRGILPMGRREGVVLECEEVTGE
jgi:SPP1 family predicted phage head-tail adaptor